MYENILNVYSSKTILYISSSFLILIEQCSHRSATELLDESKAFFVKSQEVLRNRQTLRNNRTSNEQQRMTPSFRIAYVYSN